MAEAFFVNGVGMLLKAVTAHVESEIALAWGAKGELKKLQDKLVILQLVLQDAEKRQVKETSVRHWLEKLKKVAYDAQDVMDDFSYETTHQEKEAPEAGNHHLIKQFIDMVLNFCSSSNPFLFQLNMAHMIQEINGELDKIKEEIEEHNFIKGNVPLGAYNPGDDDDVDDDDRETYSSSSVNEPMIVGREAEKSRLVALLTNLESEQEALSVLPIVGMGGLGKTTLTQLIYNDEHIKNYFKDLQMWVYVSQDFDVKKILADIIAKSKDGSSASSDDSTLEKLAGNLRSNLGGKRFLLVLDDVWSKDFKKWDHLREALLCGAKGSKVIVTTRRHEVATLMGTLETCQLYPLSDEDAWSLLKQRAFRNSTRSEERRDLAEIGRRIVKRCGGIPLALKIIGSQLRSKGEDLDGWLYIQNNEIWNLPEARGILKALNVSYLLLPSHLKQCFSYCSVFRKGESIKKETLVQMWMAEGFLKAPATAGANKSSNNGNIVLEEDVGRHYVKSLLDSCFFQTEKTNDWGEVISLKMHDLVHDLAQSVVSPVDQTSVMIDRVDKDEITRSRRVQVAFTYVATRHRVPLFGERLVEENEASSTTQVIPEDLMSMIGGDNLRVLIINRGLHLTLVSTTLSPFANLKRLRVLIFQDTWFDEMPDSIADLKQLRYLDISRSKIKALPRSFVSLHNLQSLKMYDTNIVELPSDITRKLDGLRHLEIGGTLSKLTKMPKELSRLRFLQTLNYFQISKESGGHISELRFLHHLRGELEITGLDNVENKEAAKGANLKEKPNIRSLTFLWRFRLRRDVDQHDHSDVLEGLRPHTNLQGLKMKNYIGARFPRWLNSHKSMLPNLVTMEMQYLPKCDHLPPFGSFPVLKSVFIMEMDLLKRIGSEVYGETRQPFPSLKTLSLGNLKNLEEWIESPTPSLSSFPVLEELKIYGCPNLREMPTSFPMLRKLSVFNSSGTIVTTLGNSNIKTLTSLDLFNIPGLADFPPGLLSSNECLWRISITACRALRAFPREELQCLTQLEIISIGGFAEPLHSFPFLPVPDEENAHQPLRCLRTLLLSDSNAETLPQQIQHFTTIQTLGISNFPNIVALPDWLGNLASLQKLNISSCEKLKHLPSSVKALKLELTVTRCDQLQPKHKKNLVEMRHQAAFPKRRRARN